MMKQTYATPAQVGVALAAYNTSGFVSTLVVPTRADRSGDYLRPLLWCGGFTIALTTALALATSLPWAVLALVALGGPAGIAIGLIFAYQRYTGAGPQAVSDVVGAPPFRTAPQRATVVINGGRPIRRGAYQFTVLALQGVRDRAGNPLQGGFDGRFPTRGAGAFNARFNVVGGRASRPRAVLPRVGAMRS